MMKLWLYRQAVVVTDYLRTKAMQRYAMLCLQRATGYRVDNVVVETTQWKAYRDSAWN